MEDTLELIKAIPAELREQFQKDYIKIKLWQRKMLGWAPVHAEFNGKINKKLALINLNDRVTVTLKQLVAKQPARQCNDTLELIKALPTELRERILKEHIKIKLWERKMLGWDEVHDKLNKGITQIKLKQRKALGWDQVREALGLAPYCYHNEQIVNILFCYKCNRDRCPLNYLCNLCHRNGFMHYLVYPAFDENDYDECFKKSFYAGWSGVRKL